MLKVVHDADASNENGATGGSLLDEIVRDGARAMLAAAMQAEVAAYSDAHGGEVDENGYRLVVRIPAAPWLPSRPRNTGQPRPNLHVLRVCDKSRRELRSRQPGPHITDFADFRCGTEPARKLPGCSG